MDVSSGQAKKQKRAPNKVGTVRQRFTEVDPSNGTSLMPKEFVKGYFLQVAAILREVVNVNEPTLMKKVNLHTQLISRLHARYEFPPPYNNENLKGNVVNKLTLTRFSKALSGYKTMVRVMIKQEKPFAEIQRHFPRIKPEDFQVFLDNESLEFTKKQTA